MKHPLLMPVLSLICAAVLLIGLSFGLRGIATAQAQAEHIRMMQVLLPGSETFTREPYSGEDANIRSVHKGATGFVIEVSTYGYADEITLLVGVNNDGIVTGVVVTDMHETVGLGMEALTDTEFLGQFIRSEGSEEVGSTVDALTGATVTSKAIARCINSAVAYVTGADVDSGATSWGG